jgi:NAD(P)-dependent dehydrogenase (short-subunit alcohol dehydrogenase family)
MGKQVPMGERLSGRVVLFTEAGEGDAYGRSWALAAAREGARVAIADARRELAATVAEEVRCAGGDAIDLAIDVTSEASCRDAVEEALGRFGRIDVLVNDAHLWLGLRRDDHSREYLLEVLGVNGLGAWTAARAVVPHMRSRRSGKIINLSSIGAFVDSPVYAEQVEQTGNLPSFSYALSRVFVNGLTRFMARALGPSGITVNALAIGMILSEGTRRQLTEAQRQAFVDRAAMRRILEIRDTDGAFLHLASSDSDAMSGQVVVVDGGLVMLG